MNYDLNKMLNRISSNIDGTEQLMVPYLAVKAQQSLKERPSDKTLGALSVVLSKMISHDKTFISRANFQDLYNKSFVRGTKAGEIFEKELISATKTASVTYAPKQYATEIEASKDELLSTALQDVFAGRTVREYSAKLAESALNVVAKSLNVWGMKPQTLAVNAGNSKTLIIKADYETPKGITSVYIPVDISQDKVIESSLFMGNMDPLELNNSNLKTYIKRYAGAKLNISGELLLKTIDSATAGGREVSATEMALISLKAKRAEGSEHAEHSVLGLQLDPVAVPDVQARKFAETDLFAEKFATTYGSAAGTFGTKQLELSRNAILRTIASFGYKNPQIKLKDSSSESVSYAVSLGSVAFTVPVAIKGGLVQAPTLFISNGAAYAFTSDSIAALHNDLVDSKASAVASPLHGLSSGNLVNEVRTAMSEGNLTKAKDALNVLEAAGDQVGYTTAFAVYLSGLSPKTASVKTQCSAMTSNSTTLEKVCSHTGLPVSKVYQDQHGNCRPHWRQDLDDTSESVVSFNAKVFI